jgi:hypothetical protein
VHLAAVRILCIASVAAMPCSAVLQEEAEALVATAWSESKILWRSIGFEKTSRARVSSVVRSSTTDQRSAASGHGEGRRAKGPVWAGLGRSGAGLDPAGRRPQTNPRPAQDRPKTSPDRPRPAQTSPQHPKTGPDRPRPAQTSPHHPRNPKPPRNPRPAQTPVTYGVIKKPYKPEKPGYGEGFFTEAL